MYGRKSINNTMLNNIIEFKINYNASFPQGGSAESYSKDDYTDRKMISFRDKKDGKWLIDDMRY